MAQRARRDPSQPGSRQQAKRPCQPAADRDEGAQRIPLPSSSSPQSARHALSHEAKGAEDALRESEEHFHRLSEAALEGIVIHDKGRILEANEQYAKMLGYDAAEVIGMHVLDFTAPESRDLVSQNIESQHEKPYEHLALTRDGSTFPVEVCRKSIPYRGRTAMVTAVRDISERKRAEEELLRQRAVLDVINKVLRETLTCETDADVARACIEAAQELTASKFGFIGEINQAGRFDTIALTDPGWGACRMPRSNAVRMIKDMELRGIWSKVLKDEKPLIVNNPASHPDRVGTPEGHPPLTSFLGVPLNHRGKTIGMIGLANNESGYDVADQENVEALSVAFVEALNRKRAEEALRESEERYRLLAENATDVIWTVDMNLRPTYVSPSVTRMQGYTVEEAMALSVEEALTPASLEAAMEAFTEELAIEEMEEKDLARTRTLELEHTCKDGSTVWAEVKVTALRDEDGHPVGILGVSRDITERKRAEEALEKAREELEWKVERQMRRGNAYGLTFRELTVLNLVARGTSDREIGIILGISHLTAQKHVANILGKMDAASRTEAGVRALREGLLD